MDFKSPEEVARLAEPDPEFVQLMSTVHLPQLDYSDQPAFLSAVETLQAAARAKLTPPPLNEVAERDVQYTNREGTRLRARVYSRPSQDQPGPLIMHYHGGGNCVGTPEDEAQAARTLVRAYNVVCVCPQYRLAPQHPFPAGINDAWDALVHFSQNAKSSFNADPALGLIVTGTSAGASMSAVLAHLARDNALSPPITGVHLSCGAMLPPSVCPPLYLPWHQSHTAATDPILTPAGHAAFMRAYNPDLSSPLYIPSLNPRGLANLPKHTIHAAGMDLVRDDSVVYTMMLRDAGVETKLQVFGGVPHAWFAFCQGIEMEGVYWRELVEAFGWLLGVDGE